MNVDGREVILDGAHNVDGIKALLTTMQFIRNDDTVFISKNFRTRLTDEMIYDILNCEYKATDFSDKAQKIIENSSSAQKDFTLLRKGRSVSEVFSIYEKQKTLVLTKK